MALCDDEMVIRVGHETIVLRPTLRAAFRLERRFNGFDNLLKAIAEENISAMATVICETAEDDYDLIALLENHGGFPLGLALSALVGPLVNLTLALAGVTGDDLGKEQTDAPADRVSFAEHHERLFRFATGWLSWTPETAWNSTPNEITEAYQGRLDMLKAIFGGGEGKKTPAMTEDAFAGFLRARKAA
jgi:hypothetical protein